MSDPAIAPLPVVPAPEKRKRAPFVAAALVGSAAVAFTIVSVMNAGKESTDDAFVEAHVAPVAARAPGQVLRVLIKDGQVVKAGDILIELDPADLAARLELAEADLASARAQKLSADAQFAVTTKTAKATLVQARGGLNQAASGVDASKASLDQAKADLSAAQTRLSLAAIELSRSQGLFERNAVSKADLDGRQSIFDQARAATEQAEARMANTAATISGSQGGLGLHRLRDGQHHRDSDVGISAAALRHPSLFHGVDLVVHFCQRLVRHRLEPAVVGGVSHFAGHRRRRDHPHGAGDVVCPLAS